jgi:hypothetical protein
LSRLRYCLKLLREDKNPRNSRFGKAGSFSIVSAYALDKICCTTDVTLPQFLTPKNINVEHFPPRSFCNSAPQAHEPPAQTALAPLR